MLDEELLPSKKGYNQYEEDEESDKDDENDELKDESINRSSRSAGGSYSLTRSS